MNSLTSEIYKVTEVPFDRNSLDHVNMIGWVGGESGPSSYRFERIGDDEWIHFEVIGGRKRKNDTFSTNDLIRILNDVINDQVVHTTRDFIEECEDGWVLDFVTKSVSRY